MYLLVIKEENLFKLGFKKVEKNWALVLKNQKIYIYKTVEKVTFLGAGHNLFQKNCHSFYSIIFNYVYMCLLCVYVHVSIQAREAGPLELELPDVWAGN